MLRRDDSDSGVLIRSKVGLVEVVEAIRMRDIGNVRAEAMMLQVHDLPRSRMMSQVVTIIHGKIHQIRKHTLVHGKGHWL